MTRKAHLELRVDITASKSPIIAKSIANQLGYTEQEKATFAWGNDYQGGNTSKDFIPKEGDFVRRAFRLLSANTIVGAYSYKAVEFPADVLKAATKKLEGKPALIDHAQYSVKGAVGIIEKVQWQDAFINEDGEYVPAGIIGVYRIDAKSHTDIARALMSEPPTIQGSSVGLEFEYKPSHVFHDSNGDEDHWMFHWNLGKMMSVNGKEEMVRRIATNIIDFDESSLVNFPADVYAKALDSNGNPINVKRGLAIDTNTDFNFTSTEQKEAYKAEVEQKGERIVMSTKFHQDLTPKDTETLFLAMKSEFEQKLKDEKEATKTLLSEKANLEAKVKNLETEVLSKETTLQEVQTLHTKTQEQLQSIQTAKREELKGLYRKSLKASEQVSEYILGLIDKAPYNELSELAQGFGLKLQEEFAMCCKSCGSEDIILQSSEQKEDKLPEANKINIISQFRK
jgi:hypothetical protein